MNTMRDRYIACMVLHAVGDTIGYKNGEWEFKRGGLNKIYEKVYEFIGFGGVNHLSLKGWRYSDDTILHLATAAGLLDEFNSINTLCLNIKKHYLDSFEKIIEKDAEGASLRMPGITTIAALKKLKTAEWNQLVYDIRAGGSGAAMRSPCIGLAFPFYDESKKHIEGEGDMIIQVALETARMTHNSATGYLGAITAALFTSYAIRNVPINEWPFLLVKLIEGGRIGMIIKSTGREYDNYKRDHGVFLQKWKAYIDNKFDDNKKVVKRRSDQNLYHRSKYYEDNYAYSENTDAFIGSGGDDSVIIAFDALIDAGNSWEKLIFYAMLHAGDTDTTGCLAGAWWGALYGFMDIPDITVKDLEDMDKIKKVGDELYEKFYLPNKLK